MSAPMVARAIPATRSRSRAAFLAGLFASVWWSPQALAAVSMAGWLRHDGMSSASVTDLGVLDGDDEVITRPLGFTVTIEGIAYDRITISTNGWLEFGAPDLPSPLDSDWRNEALPTGKHQGPFVAAYWDDTRTSSPHIQYGVVGEAPNRTFLVDFSLDRVCKVDDTGCTADDAADGNRCQVQIHEGSNLISVRYVTSQADALGQRATIGFQGRGGSSAAAYPLTFDGPILHPTQPDEGWSVDPTRMAAIVMAAITSTTVSAAGDGSMAGTDWVQPIELPFAIALEGQAYDRVAVSANGWIEFGGNTFVNSDPDNEALPTARHTGPLLAVYWDNMKTVAGGAVRWGTVGTQPDRTFIVDFRTETEVGGSNNFAQVQMHETSNLISVRYYGADANACGQGATIGFQGRGGRDANAYPLVFDGQVLDAARIEHQGWSVFPVLGAVGLHANMAQPSSSIAGGGEVSDVRDVQLPFVVRVDGAPYTSLTMSRRGWIELGANTFGTADPDNEGLPTSRHTLPFLAGYWDDFGLQNGARSAKYGFVGTAPNRVFLADFDLDRPDTASDTDNVQFQVQIHEGSNLMNVQYRLAGPTALVSPSATIGFQTAGGVGSRAYPLSFNGKVLASSRPNMGWSIAPLPECGNGAVEPGEECDPGDRGGMPCCTGSCCEPPPPPPPPPPGTCGDGRIDDGEACDRGRENGAANGCCSAGCQFASAMRVCRPEAGPCDLAEHCTGTSDVCPVFDAKIPRGTKCQDPPDVCSLAATCDGTSNQCSDLPPNNNASCSDGEDCTYDDRCSAGTCAPGNRVCSVFAKGRFEVRLRPRKALRRNGRLLKVVCSSTTKGTCEAVGIFLDGTTSTFRALAIAQQESTPTETLLIAEPVKRKPSRVRAGGRVVLKLRLTRDAVNFLKDQPVGTVLPVIGRFTIRNEVGSFGARLRERLTRAR
jgi:hypothetical protein